MLLLVRGSCLTYLLQFEVAVYALACASGYESRSGS